MVSFWIWKTIKCYKNLHKSFFRRIITTATRQPPINFSLFFEIFFFFFPLTQNRTKCKTNTNKWQKSFSTFFDWKSKFGEKVKLERQFSLNTPIWLYEFSDKNTNNLAGNSLIKKELYIGLMLISSSNDDKKTKFKQHDYKVKTTK